MRPDRWTALLALLATAGPAWAQPGAPGPPPTPAQIKACVQQFDMGKAWRFDWKVLDIGPARHPTSNTEALGPLGVNGGRDRYGYPVHVVYTLNGIAQIDSQYWIMQDASGAWVIPAVCRLPSTAKTG